MPIPSLRPDYESLGKDTICVFAQTNFRNQMRRFGIKLDDRRRHMYIVGKTGMGKSTMMENMVLDDIYSGNGIGLVDPHGDFAEKILNYIPAKRINDVVYINPADLDFPIGFNILEVHNEGQKHLIVAGLMGIFKKIWPDVWSARMEYILNNTLLALIEYPGSTLLGINRLLSDKKYRRKVIAKVKDPVIKSFWNVEFASYTEKYAQEAVAPIQNKIGQFLSTNVIRNMVAQVKSTIDIRKLMDEGKIIIMNLSKGRIGEDNSRLLGGMLITKIQLAAMERVDTPEKDRRDFFLYVDEFQNFATPSFANILSEARKYRLSLIMAHQYVKQLDEIVADAVFGNVGTIISFRIGGGDAEMLAKEFTPVFLEEDLVNLPKFQIFLKLMIDGVSSTPFSAMTLPPLGGPTDSVDKVIRVSRERYGRPRAAIEDKIMRWAGLEGDLVDEDDEDENGELLAQSFDDLGAPTLPSPVLPPASASSALPVENVVSELPSVSEEPTLHLDSLIPRDHVVKRDAPLVENSAPIQFDSLDELSPSPKSDSPIPSASLSAANASPFVSADGEKKKRRRRRRRKSGAGGGSAS